MGQLPHVEIEHLSRILKVLDVPIGKLSQLNNNLIMQNTGTEKIIGFASIILSALHKTRTSFNAENNEENAEIRQWLEYASTILKNNSSSGNKTILRELDEFLKCRSYFVSNRITAADVVVYYFVYVSMSGASPQEKVQFLNISRWFDNIQQDRTIRQDLLPINFNTNYVLCGGLM